MTDERRVEMVRLVGEARVYDRETLLGRDASAVFPSLARQQEEAADGAAGLSMDAIQEALGARKFISESELESIRATRGVTADDGAVAVDKPLAEILRERKAAKDAEHAEKWRLMKVGKNRPLDAEELLFLDSVAAAEAERERAWSAMERAELEAFKAAVRERSAEPEAAPGPTAAEARPRSAGPSVPCKGTDPRVPAAAAHGPAASLVPPKPLIKAVVRVKPKAPAPGSLKGDAPKPSPEAAAGTSTCASGAAGATGAGPPAKRPKTADDTAAMAASVGPTSRPAAVASADGSGAAAGSGKNEGTWKGAADGDGAGSAGGAGVAATGVAGGSGSGGGLTGLIGDYGSGSDSDGGGC